jgi:FAD binding domain/Berberine and berberine like
MSSAVGRGLSGMTPVHSSDGTRVLRASAVEAATPADVRRAVLSASARGLRVAVRATGHGTLAEPSPDTLLIDTSRMRSVLVDPDRRTARVGPGATWGDVIEAAAQFGLAPVSGTNATVGVTGFTLGGGHGFLSRRHGLAADNLVRAEVVTADGQNLTAREDRRSGLFWAPRGAGGNFGVATSLEFRLHPAGEVFGGMASFDRGLAPHLLARFRDYAMPEALNVSVVVTSDAVAVRGVYAGGADDAWRALAPLFLGEPFKDTFRAMPYSETGTIGGTPPRCFELLRDVPVDAILRTAEAANAVEVKRWGGAIARGNTPAGHRRVPFSVTVDGEDIGPLAPHATGGSFLSFLKDTSRTRDAYTAADLARLLELKRAYDPDNLFGAAHSIARAPTATGLAAQRLALSIRAKDGSRRHDRRSSQAGSVGRCRGGGAPSRSRSARRR